MSRLLQQLQTEKWMIAPETMRALMLRGIIEPGALHDNRNERDWYDRYYKADEERVIAAGGKSALVEGMPHAQYIYINGAMAKHLDLCEQMWCGLEDYDAIMQQLYAAQTSVSTVVILHLQTPGGTVTGMNETIEAILRLRDSGKQVIAYVDGWCASAGVGLAAACDYVVATNYANIGGLGTKVSWYDYADMLRQAGIKEQTFVNAGSERKIMFDDGKLTPEFAAELQAEIDALAADFRARLSELRGVEITDDTFSGKLFSGMAAVDAGLVDDLVRDFPDFLESLAAPVRSGALL